MPNFLSALWRLIGVGKSNRFLNGIILFFIYHFFRSSFCESAVKFVVSLYVVESLSGREGLIPADVHVSLTESMEFLLVSTILPFYPY